MQPRTPAEMQSAWALARAQRPELRIGPELFVAHLEAVLRRSPEGTEATSLELGDLYLACGCSAGDPKALADFEAEIIAQVPSFVRRLRLAPALVDEVQQILRARLLVAAEGQPPKIAEYSGRGRLASWVRVAALRTALNLCQRADRPGEQLDEDDPLFAVGSSPEIDYVRMRYREHFEGAVREAMASLDPRQRALLRMQHVDGLNGEQIGAVYGVNRSTVSRWVAAAHDALLERVRELLQKRVGLSKTELDSLAVIVRSHLEISAHALFAGA